MLRAILNKSWRQHPTKHQLYGHLPPIAKTIKVRRTRHAGHYWKSRDELISDVLLWPHLHGRAKAGWPARIYIQQLCEDTECSSEDLIGRTGERGSGISMLVARQDDDELGIMSIIHLYLNFLSCFVTVFFFFFCIHLYIYIIFLSNSNNCIVLSNHSFLIIICTRLYGFG